MTFGSLFAGIGGFDLGFERAGLVCKWQVEIDDYATRVLEKHWPNVHRERDIRECGKHNLEYVDVICGGFPCQDVSAAGKQSGVTGERSGLYSEVLRITCELRPQIIVLENVAALLFNGMGRVFGDLAAIGYGGEWATIPASRFGAPHQRDRVFILAYRDGERPITPRYFTRCVFEKLEPKSQIRARGWPGKRKPSKCIPNRFRWVPVNGIRGVAHGVPTGVDRARWRGIGNAVVPQVAEFIGRQLLQP